MPTFSEIYPTCLLLIGFLVTGLLLLRRYPLPDDVSTRDIQVDGLRALLAFGVALWHYFMIRDVIHVNELLWRSANVSKVILLTSSWPVQMFFAITAYLFSSRFGSKGCLGISWLKFYVGRCFRLIPVCILCSVIIFLLMNDVFFDRSTGANTTENWLNLANLGTSSIRKGPGYLGNPRNAEWNFTVPIGVHWTLHYEWLFYALLPVLASVRRLTKVFWLCVSFAMVTFIMKDGKDFFADWETTTWAFVPGLILGLTSKYWKHNTYLRHPITAGVAMTTVITSAFYSNLYVKIPANTLFLAVILCNNTATRCLESKLLRSMGETTYSIYLLHGIVQYINLKWIVTIPIARDMPEWLWWLTCTLQIVVIVIIARLSFEYVEKPGVKSGKRFYSCFMNLIERRAPWLMRWI